MKNKPIVTDFLKVSQPLGDFYVGKMRFEDLLEISFADIRRIEKDEQTGYESYFGIQRKLSQRRVKEISEYVTTLDAAFPSSILLAIDEYSISEKDFDKTKIPNVSFDPLSKKITIQRKKNIAHIIDGQHRVFGLKKAIKDNGVFSEKLKDFEVIVTIFVNMDDENQALVFSTINKAHTKVNKSLVYDLYELASTRSPQRVVHNIVKLLNEKDGSPFKDKVKMLGISEDSSKEIITQSTLAELMLGYISKKPMIDRDHIKRGKSLSRYQGRDFEKYFFRDWFIDKNDAKIAKLIWNYFKSIENKWSKAWGNPNYVLTKSTGVIAFMRFLKHIIAHYGMYYLISIEEFEKIIEKIKIEDEDFINDKYQAGGVGQADLYKELKSQSGIMK